MKRDLIKKIIYCTAITTSLVTVIPLNVYAATWVNDNMGNYYFYESNSYAVGWRNIDGTVYYFDASGVMQKGWIQYGGSWYYLDNNGALKTGWIKYNGEWYYSDSAGIMQTGILQIDGQTYCFGNNGVMKRGSIIINGQFYTIGANGAIISNTAPVPDKIFDSSNNCVQQITSTDSERITSPNGSKYDNPIEDQSEIGDYEEPKQKFTVTFRDENGEELKTKKVEDGNTVKMYEPDDESDDDRDFVEWNTKRDGSGKGYDDDDKVKVTKDLTLYAIWEEKVEKTEVTKITISDKVSEVEIGNPVQLTADVSPSDATNTKIKWSVVSSSTDTGKATIDSNGMITGVTAGTITVKAEASDGSGISATKTLNVVEAKIRVNEITITGPDKIDQDGGTAQYTATITPENAGNKNVSWKIVSGSEYASIDHDTGVVTAIADGKVVIKASARDGSGVESKVKEITISNQTVKASRIKLYGYENVSTVAVGNKLQMVARIYPDDVSSSNTDILWNAKYITGEKAGQSVPITEGRLENVHEDTSEQSLKYAYLQPDCKGKIEVTATSSINNKVSQKISITAVKDVDYIDIRATSSAGAETNKIDTDSGKLSLKALFVNSDNTIDEATDTKSVKWSLKLVDESGNHITNDNVSDYAILTTYENTAILAAKKNGYVEVTATANDSTKKSKSIIVKITNQKILAKDIELSYVTTTGAPVQIQEGAEFNIQKGQSFTIKGSVIPDNATNKDIEWTVLGKKEYITATKSENQITIKADKDLNEEHVSVRIKATADGVNREVKLNVYENVGALIINTPSVVISGVPFNVTTSVYPENIHGDKIKLETVTDDTSLTGSAYVSNTYNVNKNNSTVAVTPGNVGTIKLKATAILNESTNSATSGEITVLAPIQNITLAKTASALSLAEGEINNSITITPSVNGQAAGGYLNYLKWQIYSKPNNVEASIDSTTGILTVTRTGSIDPNAKIIVRVSGNYEQAKNIYSDVEISLSNAPVQNSEQSNQSSSSTN